MLHISSCKNPTGTVSYNRGQIYQCEVAGKSFHGIAANKNAWDCHIKHFQARYITVRGDCRSLRSGRTNRSIVGSPKLFPGSSHSIIYLLGLGRTSSAIAATSSNVWGLLEHCFWGRWTFAFLGLLDRRIWGRWTSSGLLGGTSASRGRTRFTVICFCLLVRITTRLERAAEPWFGC